MNKATFNSPFHVVTVTVDGLPLSLNAEVEVVLKRPTKLDKPSARAWDALKGAQSLTVTLAGVEKAHGG